MDAQPLPDLDTADAAAGATETAPSLEDGFPWHRIRRLGKKA